MSIPEHLCEYEWENCWATGTHKYQSVFTTKAGEFTYTAELCGEHLCEQLAALAAQFKADANLNRTVSITPIPVSVEVSQIGTGK